MTSHASIKLDNVSLRLPVQGLAKTRRATSEQAGILGGQIIGGRRPFVQALENVSFAVNEGSQVAIIGGNGSGKTTLLRLLAGIYFPTKGTCEVEGSVSCLFAPTLGLRAYATGWENASLACALYGLSASETRELVPRIAEFSELGDYFDLPLSAYSAGMKARLGFSIITSLNPSILLIDEIFGAGDRGFHNKARSRVEAMMEHSKIFILASQDETLLKKFCKTAIWLDRGRIRRIGPIDKVMERRNTVRRLEAKKRARDLLLEDQAGLADDIARIAPSMKPVKDTDD